MNAVAKVEENAPKVEMEAPAQPAAAPVAVAPPVQPAPAPKKKRRIGRFFLMFALPAALVIGGGYVWVTGGRYQETENANLQQAKVSIASDTAGRIVQVAISDNQTVKKGDLLFAIDPEPYRIALGQADAAVAAARLNVEQLRAAYSQALAQEKSASSEVAYAQSQYDRAADLAQKGINAKSSLDEARNDLDKAKQQLAVADQGIVSAKAALGGNPDIETDKHPTVMSALAARDKAAYDLAQSTVRAPADG
ncbi:HlyD family secretion protein, partial [Mesorhizobium sp. M8A.F.Ca.ET.023.02.2.1]